MLLDASAPGSPLLGGVAAAGARHQETIVEAIRDLVGPGMDEIDAVAVARGPGSHTGLRVGLATAAGLAFGRRLAVYPLSSLAVAAHRARLDAGSVLAVVAAGRGRVHVQAFSCAPGRRNVEGAPGLTRLEDVIGPAMMAGEQSIVAAAADRGLAVAPQNLGPDALAAAAAEAVEAGGGVEYDELKGDYGDHGDPPTVTLR